MERVYLKNKMVRYLLQ